ncbi:GNAT family N-acetyltransferase [Chitinophaga sp. HK235]|uniref:GNAT family N-acetyltransferase n=1 Tax=Chitinophaga sp. HK235 TaxID=2952571 RepID=UPI001BA6525A|nr:GNAT family N-acetyltransferase [Chitinophaga sp. HK235]
MNKIIFETERLLIREVEVTDFDNLFAICSNEELMQFVGDGILSKELTQKWIAISIENYDSKGFGMSAVIHKSNNRFIGYCGIVFSKAINDYELIYAIEKEYWGKGLATEVAAKMVQYGFEKLKFKTIYASIDPANIASKKILLKIGFKEIYTKHDEAGYPTIYYSSSGTDEVII